MGVQTARRLRPRVTTNRFSDSRETVGCLAVRQGQNPKQRSGRAAWPLHTKHSYGSEFTYSLPPIPARNPYQLRVTLDPRALSADLCEAVRSATRLMRPTPLEKS